MTQRRTIRVAESLLVGALIAAALAGWVQSIASNSPTYDECGHVVSGIYHWQTGRFDSYAVNPPLPRMVQTALLAGRPIDADGVRDGSSTEDWWRREWPLAEHVLRTHGNGFLDWLPWARSMNLLFLAVGYGCCVAILNRCLATAEDGQRAAGRVALTALYFGDPLVIGYAGFAMPETASLAAGPLATLLLLRDWDRPTVRSAVAAGIGAGLAVAVKTTWLVGLPLWAAAVAAARLGRRSGADRSLTQAAAQAIGAIAAFLATAWFVLCLSYGFDGVGVPLADYRFVAEPLSGETVRQLQQSAWGQCPVPLPAWFVKGVDLQKFDFLPRFSSYFAGTHRWWGWREYYLTVAFYRWPIAWLLALLPAAAVAVVRFRGAAMLLWITPLALALFVSLNESFTNHFRYLVPAYPFLHLLVARLVGQLRRRLRWIATGTLLVGFVQTLTWAPNQIAYTNHVDDLLPREFVYGINPVDSTIDYGQNLLALRNWLDRHPEVELDGAVLSHFPTLLDALELSVPPPPVNRTTRDLLMGSPDSVRWYAFDIRGLYDLNARRYDAFLEIEPAATIHDSIFVYRVPPLPAVASDHPRPFVIEDPTHPDPYR